MGLVLECIPIKGGVEHVLEIERQQLVVAQEERGRTLIGPYELLAVIDVSLLRTGAIVEPVGLRNQRHVFGGVRTDFSFTAILDAQVVHDRVGIASANSGY